VRIESSVTAVSWVPLGCVEGGQRLAFHVGAAQVGFAAVPGDRIDRGALAELARTRGWPGPGGDPA
jgi:hypothetical protein